MEVAHCLWCLWCIFLCCDMEQVLSALAVRSGHQALQIRHQRSRAFRTCRPPVELVQLICPLRLHVTFARVLFALVLVARSFPAFLVVSARFGTCGFYPFLAFLAPGIDLIIPYSTWFCAIFRLAHLFRL